MNPATFLSRSLIIVSCPRIHWITSDRTIKDMPSCDGVEATKRLRILENQQRVSVKLPSKFFRQWYIIAAFTSGCVVVALSADCQESTKKLCLSAGMDAFFSKPLRNGVSPPL